MGFYYNYNVGVVGASFKQEQPDLGIWIQRAMRIYARALLTLNEIEW